MRLPIGLLLSTFLSIAGAQTALRVPALGSAYDAASGTIRPIAGIPGAAVLGPPVAFEFPLALAAVSGPRQPMLVVSADDGAVRMLAADGSVRPLAGAMAGPERIDPSPSGTAALLAAPATGRVQVFAGLPSSAGIRIDLILPEIAGFTGAAVADDGALALVVTGDSGNGGVWLVATHGEPLRLSLPPVSAVAFRSGSHEAFAMTATGELYRIAGSSVRLAYAGGPAAPAPPVAIRVSDDATHLYTAAGDGTLASIDIATGEQTSVRCQCRPAGLVPLGQRALFLVSEKSSQTVTLFDAAGSEPRTWFVPAPPLATQGGNQ